MIRLFRKVRQKLLSENNYSLYLLYAGGEIMLVMVGILLALQIDNWNEQVVVRMKDEHQDDMYEFETVLLPYIRQHFEEWDFGISGTPVDWKSLKKDHYFIASLKINLTNITSTRRSLENGLDSAKALMVILDKI